MLKRQMIEVEGGEMMCNFELSPRETLMLYQALRETSIKDLRQLRVKGRIKEVVSADDIDRLLVRIQDLVWGLYDAE